MKRLLLLVTIGMLASSSASAEPPYAPKKANASQLIQSASYDEVPIRITMFPLVHTEVVATKGGRLDFQLTYDVMVWEFVSAFEAAAKDQAPVAVLDAAVFPNANQTELRVYGKGHHRDQTNFTLGSPDLPYTFRLVVKPNDQSKAVVMLHNAVYANLYGGTMPARVGFKPAGDVATIAFQWE